MIKGVISNNRPLAPVTISWNLQVQDIMVLVDTGFTGELKLPPSIVSDLGLEITHVQQIRLANGQEVSVPASLAYISLEGIKDSVDVIIAEGSEIIGVSLLRKFGYKLILDPKYNKLDLERQ